MNRSQPITDRPLLGKLACTLFVLLGVLMIFTSESRAAKPTGTLLPVSNLAAQAVSTSEVGLNWAYGDPRIISGYSIERSQSSSSGFQVIATVGAMETSLVDAPLASGKSYYYRVRAFAKKGHSESYSSYSSVASASTPSGAGTTAPTVDIPPALPGSFELSASAYSVNEGAGKVDITIKRVGGSSGAATVEWRTNSVTATFDQDYGSFSWTTLAFADGETQQTKSISIIDDSIVEPAESFNVSLANPSNGATLGGITTAEVTIKDNDVASADTTAPTVSITSPASGTTYTTAQTATITISAQDNVGVSKVELYDGATLVGTDATAPYAFSMSITAAGNGTHSLTAKAYDAAGNSTVSNAAILNVNIAAADVTAPTVSITAPSSGATFSSAQTVNIAATAQDNVGVTKVEFYDGSTLKGTDTGAPFTYSWAITSAVNGTHTFTAKAYDAAGNSRTSSPVSLVVAISSPTAPPPVSTGKLPVFPGAEGFGTETVAGRGGQILRVTNLNDSGSGSLRAALDASGSRIIVFEVSGTITLSSDIKIKNPYVTIAGQTAPSPGILIRGATLLIQTHDVLMQHLRIRPGDDPSGPDPSNRDSADVFYDQAYNVVIDHCSFSWSIDENIDFGYGAHDITLSNSIMSESLNDSLHSSGPHSKGLLIAWDCLNVTLLKNYMAHNEERHPRIETNDSVVMVNNLIYDFYIGSSCGGSAAPFYLSAVGNVFRYGPDSGGKAAFEYRSGSHNSSAMYLYDNVADGSVFKNYDSEDPRVSSPPVWWPGLTVLASSAVEKHVTENAGARPADRDSVDSRVISEFGSRTGNIIDTPSQVGGWPNLAKNIRSFPTPTNPNGDDDGDGYTNIEEVLHKMAAEIEGNPRP